VTNPLTAAGTVAPQANLLPIGLDQIKSYLAKGNMTGAESVMQQLRQSLGNPATAWMPADPTPFTSPQLPVSMTPGWNPVYAGAAAQPFARPSLDVMTGPSTGILGGQTPVAAMGSLIEGCPETKGRAMTPGTAEHDTVLAALRQNNHLFYDADSQRFFARMPDGSKRDVCSLGDARKARAEESFAAGGFPKFGEYLKAKVEESSKLPTSAAICNDLSELYLRGGGNPDELNPKLDEIKKQMQEYERTKRLMAPIPSVDPR
jgi:hypothetical protein